MLDATTTLIEQEKTYEEWVDTKTKHGEDIQKSMTPEKCDLLHFAVGVAGEAGELLDAVKKHVIYGKPLDEDNVIEELGDILFYMTAMLNTIGLTHDDIRWSNRAKLDKRYRGGYSDAAAAERADKQNTKEKSNEIL